MQRLLDVLHDLCSTDKLKTLSRESSRYKTGYTSKNKDIVIVERNSTREAWNAASEKLIPSRKKMSEVLAALLQRFGGRQSVVPTRENNEETLVNLFILN